MRESICCKLDLNIVKSWLSRKLSDMRRFMLRFLTRCTYDISMIKSCRAVSESSVSRSLFMFCKLKRFWTTPWISGSSNHDIFVTLASRMMIILVTYWSKLASFWTKKLTRKFLISSFSLTGIFAQFWVNSYFKADAATNCTNFEVDFSR